MATGGFGMEMFLAMTGIFVGSLIGAMAQVMPFQVVMLVGAVLMILTWMSSDYSLVEFCLIFGLFLGSVFGVMGQIMDFGPALFFAMMLTIMFWRQGGARGGGRNNLLFVPLLVIFTMGVFFNFSYSDFCVSGTTDVCANVSSWSLNQPTIWGGCSSYTFLAQTITRCNFNLFNFFGSSVLGNFVQALGTGDYIGAISALFVPSAQSVIGFVTLFISIVFILIGTGIFFQGTFLASGITFATNSAGTRLFQSLGFNMVIFAVIFLAFGGWVTTIWGGANVVFGLAMYALFATMYFMGAWQDAKDGGSALGGRN